MRRAGIGERGDERGCQGRVPRLLVLYPQRKMPRSVLILGAYLTKLGAITSLKSYEELSCRDLERFDLVVARGLPYYYDSVRMLSLIECLRTARKVINDPQATLVARNKYVSMKVLESNGVPVPKTFLVRTRFELLEKVKELGEVVVKPLSNSLGLGVNRVDERSIHYLIPLLPYTFDLVIQEYVEKVRDVRSFVIGNRAVASMYRISPFKFATNYAQGSDVDPAPLEEYSEISVKAVRALGLSYGGVDLVESPEGPKVIEVNPSPLWFGVSRACNVDVGFELAKFLFEEACED
ncbi:SSU ribosomal protein S6P modification protein [Ignicoccus hospitalis KIN4/I]|uniref:SSU ribosomal protein S6P modification protein n=1 Tax=Ignicoccus hospitalis (strain KIN4/I / DSM 18386 / JCM 14125) TaxID=453591 RepID=A8A8V0_IGNH4|nr:SSU ribosomal protein S6P modification protein [Ignicoccus hospitalis KIN4/I]